MDFDEVVPKKELWQQTLLQAVGCVDRMIPVATKYQPETLEFLVDARKFLEKLQEDEWDAFDDEGNPTRHATRENVITMLQANMLSEALSSGVGYWEQEGWITHQEAIDIWHGPFKEGKEF